MADKQSNSRRKQPKDTKSLTTARVRGGYWAFYWNGHDVTPLWMDFFSGLSMKDEHRSEELFIKKYGTKLDKQYPVSDLASTSPEANPDTANPPGTNPINTEVSDGG